MQYLRQNFYEKTLYLIQQVVLIKLSIIKLYKIDKNIILSLLLSSSSSGILIFSAFLPPDILDSALDKSQIIS